MIQRFGWRIGDVLAVFVAVSLWTLGDAALGRENTGKVILNIEGMTCARCVKTIQSVLRKIPGVEKAEVSLEQKTALVEFERGKVASGQLIRAVEGASNAMYQYKASVRLDQVILSIEGMTCARCVKTIQAALLKVPGVGKAEVSLEKKESVVAFDPTMATTDALIKAVEGASNAMFQYKASVAMGNATLRIEGMTCSSCVPRVRSALLEVPGVRSAEVRLEKGEALVAFEKGRVAPDQLVKAVEKAGYKASIAAE